MATVKARPLTGKQLAFVNAYLANGFNALQAARSAGYSDSSDKALSVMGAQNLANPKIRSEINKRQAALQERGNVTPDYIVGRLLTNADNSERDGRYDWSNKSLEIVGRHLGMFVDRSETKTYGQFRIEVVRLDDPRETAPDAIVEGKATEALPPGENE